MSGMIIEIDINNLLFILYVTSDNLFCRRYIAIVLCEVLWHWMCWNAVILCKPPIQSRALPLHCRIDVCFQLVDMQQFIAAKCGKVMKPVSKKHLITLIIWSIYLSWKDLPQLSPFKHASCFSSYVPNWATF